MAYESNLISNTENLFTGFTTFDGRTINKCYENLNEIKTFPAMLILPTSQQTAEQKGDYISFFTQYNYKIILLDKKINFASIIIGIDKLAAFAESAAVANSRKISVQNYELFGHTLNGLELLGIEINVKTKYQIN